MSWEATLLWLQYSTLSTVQYSTPYCGYSTVQYTTVQYSTPYRGYSTVQYRTLQYTTLVVSCTIFSTVCVCVHACNVCMGASVLSCVCACVCMCVCIVCMCVHMCACVCACVCMCVCIVCMCACVCLYLCVCVKEPNCLRLYRQYPALGSCLSVRLTHMFSGCSI